MTRTRVRRRRVAVSVLAGTLMGLVLPQALGQGAAPSPQMRTVAVRRYVVRPGDTVWAIAERYAEGDPRPLVQGILRRNGVSPDRLVPGRVLLLPIAS